MSGTSSIGGLVSGLDTASLIDQLMQVEATTQTRLKSRLTSAQSDVKALQDLNSRFASLATVAGDLAKSGSWNPLSVTSSSDQVAAVAGTTTLPASLHVVVGHTARAHQLSFSTTALAGDVVTSGSTKVRLDRLDGTTVDLETGDGTLAGLVTALNGPSTGLRASTVRLDDGTQRLVVTSTATGAASDFALTNLDGSPLLGGAVVTAGRDAEITIGSDTVHSATNTFSTIADGLTLTLRPNAPDGTVADIEVAADPAAMTAKVKAFVDAINDILTRIDSLSGYNAATRTAGPLSGDSTIRELRTRLLGSIYPPGGGSLAPFGVQLDRFGKVSFDQATFSAALAADPAAVRTAFTTGAAAGYATRVQSVARQASDPVTGSLTVNLASRDSGIRRLQASISDWDVRLTLRRETLSRQFNGLETTLSKLNSQSSWLSSQISTMNTSSS